MELCPFVCLCRRLLPLCDLVLMALVGSSIWPVDIPSKCDDGERTEVFNVSVFQVTLAMGKKFVLQKLSVTLSTFKCFFVCSYIVCIQSVTKNIFKNQPCLDRHGSAARHRKSKNQKGNQITQREKKRQTKRKDAPEEQEKTHVSLVQDEQHFIHIW